MNSRERVFAALKHQQPDRIPIDFWAAEEAVDKLKRHFKVDSKDAILDIVDADLRYIEGPTYTGPKLRVFKNNISEDIWGVLRQKIFIGEGDKKSLYQNVVKSPLQEITTENEAAEYDHWPSADWYDYSVIEVQCDKYLKDDRVVVFEGDRTNRIAQLKPYMYLRGTQNAFLDMVLNPSLFKFITRKIMDFYNEYLMRILEFSKGKIDIVLTGDDFGSQNNLLCSRQMWMDLLQPGFEKYLKVIKSSGAFTMHHTCGSVFPLINDMIKSGLDILQSLQPEASSMEAGKLKKKFGDKLCFNGSLSIQNTLPFGQPEDIEKEVKDRVDKLAENGGFIIGTAHNILGDVPLENILALLQAYKNYLWY